MGVLCKKHRLHSFRHPPADLEVVGTQNEKLVLRYQQNRTDKDFYTIIRR